MTNRLSIRLILSAVLLASTALAAQPSAQPSPQQRLPMQDDMWREYDLYRTRLFDLARMIPEEKYDWRPGKDTRSIREVILHVGLNNYMLLDMMGQPAPKDLYPEAKEPIFRRNLNLEKQPLNKPGTMELSERGFAGMGQAIREAAAADLDKPAMFGQRKTTHGGLQLRAIAHLHEHLGQMIAYARSVGVVPPWSQ